MAQLNRIIPLSFEDNTLTIAMCDPQKLSIIDELRSFLGYDIKATVCTEKEMLKAAVRGCPGLYVALSFLLGPYDPIHSPSGQLLVAYSNRRVPGYPAGGLNFIDARDAAKGLILAAQKGRVGERYIIGNVNMRFRDFFRLIEEVTGIRAPRMRLPRQLLYPVGLIAPLVSQHITHRRPIMSIPRVRMSDLSYHYDNRKAVTELGLTFRDLKDSIKDTIRWFRDNGYITNKKSLATVRDL
jgi:dihydroflavonol-4-reductase